MQLRVFALTSDALSTFFLNSVLHKSEYFIYGFSSYRHGFFITIRFRTFRKKDPSFLFPEFDQNIRIHKCVVPLTCIEQILDPEPGMSTTKKSDSLGTHERELVFLERKNSDLSKRNIFLHACAPWFELPTTTSTLASSHVCKFVFP